MHWPYLQHTHLFDYVIAKAKKKEQRTPYRYEKWNTIRSWQKYAHMHSHNRLPHYDQGAFRNETGQRLRDSKTKWLLPLYIQHGCSNCGYIGHMFSWVGDTSLRLRNVLQAVGQCEAIPQQIT